MTKKIRVKIEFEVEMGRQTSGRSPEMWAGTVLSDISSRLRLNGPRSTFKPITIYADDHTIAGGVEIEVMEIGADGHARKV